MTEIELELTYLAKILPEEIRGVVPTELVDTMIPDSGVGHPQLRLRKKGNKFELCKKVPVDGIDFSMHSESTIELNKSEYAAIKRCSNKSLSKDRYKVLIAGYPAEVDVFKDYLKGLIIIDFEFDNLEAKEAFKVPDVCLCDVTQEEFIAGGLLAGKKYSDIADKLAQFGYNPIF